MKRISIISAILLLAAVRAVPEPQNGVVVTIGASATRLIPNPSTANPVMANSLLIQVQHGGTGFIYVLNADPSVTCTKDGAGTTTVAELAPGTATASGPSFTFPSNGAATSGASGFDIRRWCLSGTVPGDVAITSWDLR